MTTPSADAHVLLVVLLVTVAPFLPTWAAPSASVFPAEDWETRAPEAVGLDPAKLDAVRDHAEGRGCVVRNGYLVYTWGDHTRATDVASAVKPWISHFMFKAVEDGRLASVDTKVSEFEPRLADINSALGYKDRAMTFRHLAFQTACYGLADAPGTAFDYNDWQMAFFFDTLFLKVYGETHESLDTKVLRPMLTDLMQCQDNPSFFAFGPGDRPGRMAVSPRDFARFGLLYLNKGNWSGRQLISEKHAVTAVTSPLSTTIPRTSAGAVEMIEGQRSIGSRSIPDNQCDHRGSYSWLWWVNGITREGNRNWPDAPPNTFAALGHGGKRGMAILPGLDLIVSWNDSKLDERPLNEVFRLLMEATTPSQP
jgi:CubicO group peptidase (beta-lactamase class C family)